MEVQFLVVVQENGWVPQGVPHKDLEGDESPRHGEILAQNGQRELELVGHFEAYETITWSGI